MLVVSIPTRLMEVQMPKSPKKTSSKPGAKKAAAPAKPKKTKEPKINFMMKVLKEREEKRRQEQELPYPIKPMPQTNVRSTNMKNPGFIRFAGPRRKAG